MRRKSIKNTQNKKLKKNIINKVGGANEEISSETGTSNIELINQYKDLIKNINALQVNLNDIAKKFNLDFKNGIACDTSMFITDKICKASNYLTSMATNFDNSLPKTTTTTTTTTPTNISPSTTGGFRN